MEGLVGDIASTTFVISDTLISAKALAKRLSDNIKVMRELDPTAGAKALVIMPLPSPRYVYLRVAI